jgi:hypothetical protein
VERPGRRLLARGRGAGLSRLSPTPDRFRTDRRRAGLAHRGTETPLCRVNPAVQVAWIGEQVSGQPAVGDEGALTGVTWQPVLWRAAVRTT